LVTGAGKNPYSPPTVMGAPPLESAAGVVNDLLRGGGARLQNRALNRAAGFDARQTGFEIGKPPKR
jgi:hypothetical protein